MGCGAAVQSVQSPSEPAPERRGATGQSPAPERRGATGQSPEPDSPSTSPGKAILDAAAAEAQDEAAGAASMVVEKIPMVIVMTAMDPMAVKASMQHVGDLFQGVDFFKFHLAAPLEWASRVLVNAGLSVVKDRFKGTEIGDALVKTLTPQLEQVYQGIDALQNADYMAAKDNFRRIMTKIPGLLKEGHLGEHVLADLGRDAIKVRDDAVQAFNLLNEPDKRLDALSMACSARVLELGQALHKGPDGDGMADSVAGDLAYWIGEMLDVERVKHDLAYEYKDEYHAQILCDSANEDRRRRLQKLAGTMIHAERFAARLRVEPIITRLPEDKRVNFPKLVEDQKLFAENEEEGGLTAGDEAAVLQAIGAPEKMLCNSNEDQKLFAENEEEGGLTAGDEATVLQAIGAPEKMLWNSNEATAITTVKHIYDTRVLAVAIFPGGRWFLTGSSDCTAAVWDSETGREIASVKHDGGVYAVAIFPGGLRFLTGRMDCTAAVWDSETGREITSVEHDGWVRAVAIFPGGRRFLTGSDDCTAAVWDSETGRKITSVEHNNDVRAVAIFPGGQRFLTMCEMGGLAAVWDSETGRKITSVEHDGYVRAVAIFPGGRRFLTGSYDNTAAVWDADTGGKIASAEHHSGINAVEIFPSGLRFLTGSADGTVAVWDSETGRHIGCVRHDGRGVSSVSAVKIFPGGRRFLTGSEDFTAAVWDSETGRKIASVKHKGDVDCIAIFPGGQRFLTSSRRECKAIVWGEGDN